MARKNGMEGAIPGAGRKGDGKHKVAYKISDKAKAIIDTKDNKSDFVSKAIVFYEKATC
ncbi:hypothetical protein [Sphingobacterium griseoflavum]|uniref:Uncharacterized protein n=1 Tax=Sphingobacterium griseoflavum TaxID=1474952 RepID=A0ABQ3HWL8_9SPHI|nr:hypothetical protein [Sphingobacterium griseoflavum]GHE34981.1 hypothetical protein GCM10017764_17710 [Sphingobacterium griseoflavum]